MKTTAVWIIAAIVPFGFVLLALATLASYVMSRRRQQMAMQRS